MAKARDEHFAKTGKPIGPLHGLPVSLKDNFNLKGLDATLGFASHVGDAAQDDSALAKLIEDAGAVFYVKTNVPTAMMIAETINNVFGRTLNPLNRKLTPGGSSGGESALIVFKGSPLGVGSDIGMCLSLLRLLYESVNFNLTCIRKRWLTAYPCRVHWYLHSAPIVWSFPNSRYTIRHARSGNCQLGQWSHGAHARRY